MSLGPASAVAGPGKTAKQTNKTKALKVNEERCINGLKRCFLHCYEGLNQGFLKIMLTITELACFDKLLQLAF
jgi:hypothetical protein